MSNEFVPTQPAGTFLKPLHKDLQPENLRYHRKRVAVTKEFTFDAAHHLYMYDGKCKNLHGHTYRLAITLSGHLNDIGMVMDFGDLKQMFRERVESRLDHAYLNEALPTMNTTAENMVVWIWEQLEAGLSDFQGKLDPDANQFQDLRLEQLVFHETPTSSVTLKREWMMT